MTMATLRMNGERCASLEDVRANFDFTNAKDYLVQGRLSQWVRDLGERELADELDELKVADYSDQTLLDNFIGIFGLPKEQAGLPEEDPPEEEEEPPPEVSVDPCAALRNVEDSEAGLSLYLKNKIILKIIRDIVRDSLPEDMHSSIVITVESNFVEDLNFGELQLDMLAQRLNEEFDTTEDDGFKVIDGRWIGGAVNGVAAAGKATCVGHLMDLAKPIGYLTSYINAETIPLLDGVFTKTTLKMRGVWVASLEEFRENFYLIDAKDYLRQGRLSRWVRELGENGLADELDELKGADYDDKALLENFIDIFGLNKEQVSLPVVTVDPELLSDSNSKVVSKIILEIIRDNPPDKRDKPPDRISADSRFVEDLGLDTDRLGLLADRLNEKFTGRDNRFSGASKGILYYSPPAKTVGDLLVKIKRYKLKPKF